MPEVDKQKILQQVEFFRSEKLKFDREVAKWDDAGNDIIVLAKHMCMIMMEMTDFTRWVTFLDTYTGGQTKSSFYNFKMKFVENCSDSSIFDSR